MTKYSLQQYYPDAVILFYVFFFTINIHLTPSPTLMGEAWLRCCNNCLSFGSLLLLVEYKQVTGWFISGWLLTWFITPRLKTCFITSRFITGWLLTWFKTEKRGLKQGGY